MTRLTVTADTPSYEIIDYIKRELERCKIVNLILEPVFSTRTKSQNSLFQVLVKRIAFQSGASVSYVKEKIKEMACNNGYPYERDENGEFVTDEHGQLIPLSSSKASIAEMKKLIDACYALALEWGFILEDTQD